MKYLWIAVLCVLPMSAGLTGEHGMDKDHVLLKPDQLKWGKAPPALPPGAEMAVLAGDPSKKGSMFVIRAKLPDGYKVPPHFHPTSENVTVLKGEFMIGRGDKFDKDKLETLPAGSFMHMPKDIRHFAMAKGETTIQLHGVGPFEITYIDPTDDPRNKGK